MAAYPAHHPPAFSLFARSPASRRPSHPRSHPLEIGGGCPGYHLPDIYPSYQTCYRRYLQWSHSGLLPQVYKLLYQDLAQRGGLDLLEAIHTGLISLKYRRRHLSVHYPDHLRGTWQILTALVLIGVLDKEIRPRPLNKRISS